MAPNLVKAQQSYNQLTTHVLIHRNTQLIAQDETVSKQPKAPFAFLIIKIQLIRLYFLKDVNYKCPSTITHVGRLVLYHQENLQSS